MGRATLAPRAGMVAAVPPLRERPLANMKDMGMGDMDMSGDSMAGMDHSGMAMGAESGAAAMEMPAGESMPGMEMPARSEEHTSELQSLMRISYAVFCLKKKTAVSQEHDS